MITEDGLYKRVVTQRGSDDHAFYVACGLHEELVSAGMVLDFQEEPVPVEQRDWARLLVPEQLAFVQHPSIRRTTIPKDTTRTPVVRAPADAPNLSALPALVLPENPEPSLR